MSRETLRARLEAAERMVNDLCSGKERWTMRVPADPDRDSDLVISGALGAIHALLALSDAAEQDIERCDACRTNPVAWGPDRGWCAVHELTGGALAALEALP